MPRTLQKNIWLLKLYFVKEAFDPLCVAIILHFMNHHNIFLRFRVAAQRVKNCTWFFTTSETLSYTGQPKKKCNLKVMLTLNLIVHKSFEYKFLLALPRNFKVMSNFNYQWHFWESPFLCLFHLIWPWSPFFIAKSHTQ